MRAHWGKTVFGVAVTVLLLWWALHDVSLREVWELIGEGDPLLLLAAVTVATLGFLIRAMRWRILLAPVKPDTTFRSRFTAVSIGFMANNVLPARVGEFARALAFSRLEPVSASAAFGSLVVERVLDGLVLLLFLVLPVFSPGFPGAAVFSEGMGSLVLKGAVAALAVVGGCLAVMVVWPRAFVRFAVGVSRWLPRSLARPLVDSLESFLSSLQVLRSPRLLTLAVLWSLAFWSWHAVSFWLGMKAFGIDTGFVSAVFTEAVVGFGVAIPSAPGFVGTFHASASFALSDVYGVEAARSLAFAFGYHFGGWIPVTVIGLHYAWKMGLSLGDVGAAEEIVEEAIEAVHPEGKRALEGEV
ncbi:MAG: flippase-like domain-containing protein [Gemmatimonadota bacterium]|nr:flippase-like domain-containing protein [Gemmatimonadota bacterium]